MTALLAGWALLEAACAAALGALWLWLGIRFAPRDRPRLSRTCRRFIERLIAAGGKGDHLELDAALGWTARPNASSRDGRIHVDARGARRGGVSPGAGLRVAAFGDCLTLGGGVSDADTWPARLEQLAPELEVLNFGVDGYGPDQMLLRYLERAAACPGIRVAVLALAATNLYKTRNAFRPFYAHDHGLQLAKPRFVLRDGALQRTPNPLPTLAAYRALLEAPESQLARLGALDAYHGATYRGGALDWLPSVRLAKVVTGERRKLRAVRDRRGDYVPGSEALRLTQALVDEFCGRAHDLGAEPVVALLPLRADVRRFARTGVRTYEPLLRHCAERKHACVDGLDALGSREAGELFAGIHYTPLANQRVASAVLAEIRSRSLR